MSASTSLVEAAVSDGHHESLRGVTASPKIPSVRRAIVCFVLSLAVGCGGGEGGRPPFAPTMPAEKAPRTVEEAQQRIDRARSEIDRPAGSPAAPAPAPDPAPQSTDAPSATPDSHAQGPCSSPCRALASMRRAVDALCELTGASDERCANAKKTLDESRAKVGPCSCE